MHKLVIATALVSVPSYAANPGQGQAPSVDVATVFRVSPVATLPNPWAMAVLPDSSFLVTDKSGALRTVATDGRVSSPIPGVPVVKFEGQGGLLDVAIHPDFATNRLVYLSFAEAGLNGTSGLALGRGKYVNGRLQSFAVIWRDRSKTGGGHFSGRIVFAPDKTLFLTSGDRQQATPAQVLSSTQGKVLHMTAGGNPAPDNPNPKSRVWTLGHRNPLGIAFDASGTLWTHEHGPQGGDEINVIERNTNYGWPLVSNGRNYGSPTDDIPNHDARPEFNAPETWWDPSIAPSGMIIYSGSVFPQFAGNMFLGGLASQALIRVTLTGKTASETVRYAMGARIREVEQGPDGAIWVLEDGSTGRLLRLTPR